MKSKGNVVYLKRAEFKKRKINTKSQKILDKYLTYKLIIILIMAGGIVLTLFAGHYLFGL